MSKSSKMGLFGSKDKPTTSEGKTMGQDESPERYTPYGVDSDSETYDTEALSMMDINDIIGVQSASGEPGLVSESTLESEIDALSKVITDTKEDIVGFGKDESDSRRGNFQSSLNTSLQLIGEAYLSEEDSMGLEDEEEKPEPKQKITVEGEEKKESLETEINEDLEDRKLEKVGDGGEPPRVEGDREEASVVEDPVVEDSVVEASKVDVGGKSETEKDRKDEKTLDLETPLDVSPAESNLSPKLDSKLEPNCESILEMPHDSVPKKPVSPAGEVPPDTGDSEELESGKGEIKSQEEDIPEESSEKVEDVRESPGASIEEPKIEDSSKDCQEPMEVQEDEPKERKEEKAKLEEMMEVEPGTPEEDPTVEDKPMGSEEGSKEYSNLPRKPKDLEEEKAVEEASGEDTEHDSGEIPAEAAKSLDPDKFQAELESQKIPTPTDKSSEQEEPPGEVEESKSGVAVESISTKDEEIKKCLVEEESIEVMKEVPELREDPMDAGSSELEKEAKPLLETGSGEKEDPGDEVDEKAEDAAIPEKKVKEEGEEEDINRMEVDENREVTGEENPGDSESLRSSVIAKEEIEEPPEEAETIPVENLEKEEIDSSSRETGEVAALQEELVAPLPGEEEVAVPAKEDEKVTSEPLPVDAVPGEVEIPKTASPVPDRGSTPDPPVEEAEKEEAEEGEKDAPGSIETQEAPAKEESGQIQFLEKSGDSEKQNSNNVPVPVPEEPLRSMEADPGGELLEPSTKSSTVPLEVEEKKSPVEPMEKFIPAEISVPVDPEPVPKEPEENRPGENSKPGDSPVIQEAPVFPGTRETPVASGAPLEGLETEEDVEMNLTLSPEDAEIPAEDIADEVQKLLSVDEEESEDQVEMNLSLDPEEKPEEILEQLEKSALIDTALDVTLLELEAKERKDDVEEDSSRSKDLIAGILDQDLTKILEEEVAEPGGDLPLEEREIQELVEKLPSEEDALSKDLEDPAVVADSLEGFLDLELIPKDSAKEDFLTNEIIGNLDPEAEEPAAAKGLLKIVDNESAELEMEFGIPTPLLEEDEEENKIDLLLKPSGDEAGVEQSPEISELESAVKFLQESEGQDTLGSLDEETSGNNDAGIFLPQQQEEEVGGTGTDSQGSADISEAEIISEAVKLESEKKAQERRAAEPECSLPKVSLLEERLKEPPKIEIPPVEVSKLCEAPTTPRSSSSSSSLLMQKDPKERSVVNELKVVEGPRKDELENVGSPRIILKIAKSAITDCSEPRSPKSPKIRSAANSPNPEDSPGQKLGKIKLKLSKGGHPSIISNDTLEETTTSSAPQWHAENNPSALSPLGMKIKLSKSGDASIIQPTPGDSEMKLKLTKERSLQQDSPKRTESPIGMKFKLSKSGDASIIPSEKPEEEHQHQHQHQHQDLGLKRTESPIGMKIKLSKSGDASIVPSTEYEESKETTSTPKRTDSPIGMKIKLKTRGGATIVPLLENDRAEEKLLEVPDVPRRTESPLGMKIKLSKSGDASIIHNEAMEDPKSQQESKQGGSESKGKGLSLGDGVEEQQPVVGKRSESSIGMKIKLSKSGDASIIHSDKEFPGPGGHPEGDTPPAPGAPKEDQGPGKRTDSPFGMKIKLSKSGDASIVEDDSKQAKVKLGKVTSKSKDTLEGVPEDRRLPEKRKEPMVAPLETKKSRMESQLLQMLPDVTIQPVPPGAESQQQMGTPTTTTIVQKNLSQQQLNVINQEISITHVKPLGEVSMSEKLKDLLHKGGPAGATGSPSNSDCEIIDHRPELIIVNENSNSSQDVMIIEEVRTPVMKVIAEPKVPKKRGRPKKSTLPPVLETVQHHPQQPSLPPPAPIPVPKDPLALDDVVVQVEHRENERPKRTCRSQKSYAPPKRGRRGRGRGKRKLDMTESPGGKKPNVGQDLTAIEASTTAMMPVPVPVPVGPILEQHLQQQQQQQQQQPSPAELFKALKQTSKRSKAEAAKAALLDPKLAAQLKSIIGIPEPPVVEQPKVTGSPQKSAAMSPESKGKSGAIVMTPTSTTMTSVTSATTSSPQNWLTPTSKKQQQQVELKQESIAASTASTVQVIDEETRMSAESGSRSQTPARSIPVAVSEPVPNEESQGSVLSTATTESEKVKVKNRRMEINFDPDEGPFTVDKIAEYEWPLDRKGETFMIQEQISQYLGVKSFKRKYPDLKRRMVDMEERNYLRENALVSEAMCDMGLTAVNSSEVLDVMCSDFPDQYEEYRKHMREKQVKEHSKKQKELTAAANAEKNRIDLAEMAVQSAVSWNVSLNKARRESRKCCLDLQTFTIHVPKKQQLEQLQQKVALETPPRGNHYPVALIPGQYTDYYREYTPAELRYYPLNTVLYGPMRPNERKFDSQSDGSQSDSDSDSSSCDSSSSSSDGTQDTEESQSTMDDVDMELATQKEELKDVKCKMCLKGLNKQGKAEVLIQCGTCAGNVHPSCIDLTVDMVPHIRSYAWQCTDCKTCAQCHDPADEDKMLFCDMCDRGYHIYCVGLRRVPQGRWHCQECAVCANCGSREAAGASSERNSVAQWQHEYKKADKNTRVYVSTLCVPCSKLRGDQGNNNRQEKLPV